MNMTIFIAIIMLMYSGLLLSINKDIKSPSAILFFIWGALLFLSGVNGDITNYTLCIILFSCLSFSVGALLAKPYAPIFEHVFSYNINNTKALVLITNIISFIILIYTLIVFLYYYKGGFTESYINLRTEINYGDKSGLIKIYGYIYYLLYPLVYVWSFLYFKNKYKRLKEEGGPGYDNNRTFISYKEYKTNVFTIFYSLTKYYDFLYSLIFFFVIGFFHSSLYNVAKKNKKTISVVICSILYFPLLFQFFDQLYMLMFYIYAIAMLYVICFCSRLTLTLKGD